MHVIAGHLGQVGSALLTVLEGEDHYADVLGFDIGTDLDDVRDDLDDRQTAEPTQLHVTFGWSAEFTDTVHHYAKELDADLVVIHSTVPPGTCDLHGWVHSPVRGRHPELTGGIYSFTKHFGGEKAALAAMPFCLLGIVVQVHDRALETELGKLVELASFGAQVRLMEETHALCERYGADFDTVYTTMASTYNDGYLRLGEDQFVRPVLDYQPPPLGGHCVAQGTALLDNDFFTDLVKPISGPSVKWPTQRNIRKG